VPDIQLFWSTLLTLFVILDPPGLLPMFLALTGAMPDKERNHAALRASVVALGVIAVFAVFGRYILAYLHISVEAMQVSGGFLLLLVALQLLMGNETTPQAGNWDSVAIVPLATPLLAGPGAIVAMMLAVEDAQDVVQYVLVAVALLTAMVLVYLFLRFAGGIRRLLRESGTILASRIAGLLLSAIAVQMVANGVFGMIAAMS
jgi:multiple antibiotic resistance protein